MVSLHGAANAAQDAAAPAFPLKVSANSRYLVDRNNVPFLVVGDSPQAMIGNLTEAEAAAYMANRVKYGINTLWVNLLCNEIGKCRDSGETVDGIAPFAAPRDLSMPNPAYFQRVDSLLKLAAAHGMAVMLNPIDTAGWLSVLRTNGIDKAFRYGQFLGNRFKETSNIIWFHGNDFQTWKNSADDALVQAVARGIASADPSHLQTVELNFFASGSLDDPTFARLVQVDSAYSYYPTYAQVLKEYNRPNFMPVIMVEANYEFERNPGTDGGSLQNLRRQEYWTMLSGAAGQLYGSAYTWQFKPDWQSNLDTPGALQLKYMKDLFAARKWFDLVPDQGHDVVTAGYGKFSRSGSVTANTYATAARTPDGTLVVVYLPTVRVVTVDMSRQAGPARARWYDPASATYTKAADTDLANRGYRGLSPPGPNSAGDGDWVLLIEATAR